MELPDHEIVAIDGKSIRGTRTGSKSIVHMVSTWADQNHLVPGQVKVDEKSNEVTAIPQLLELLTVKGSIITTDAMGCRKGIASKVIGKEANYLLSLKGNQGNLQEAVEDSFRFCRLPHRMNSLTPVTGGWKPAAVRLSATCP